MAIIVTMRSGLTGAIHHRVINMSAEQAIRVRDRDRTGELVEQIVPQLPIEDRVYLLTGSTPEEWTAVRESIDET